MTTTRPQPTPAAPPIRAPRTLRRRRSGSTTRTAWIMIAPFLLGFVLFTIVPFLISVAKSFTRPHRESTFGPFTEEFAGISNYVPALQDAAFHKSFLNVFLFGIVQIPVMLGGALVLALLLDSVSARFTGTFRLVYFLPYAVPGVISAIMWMFLCTPSVSPINRVLEPVGVSPNLLSGDVVLLALANISTWIFTGYNMLIMYSSLKAISESLYEAARMDGASGFAIAWHIKIPNILPSIMLTAVFSLIGTCQLFVEPMTLKLQVSAIDSNFTPLMAAYSQISNQSYGLGAAMSVIVTLVIAVLSAGFFRLTKNRVSL